MPHVGGCSARGAGASFSRERCVRQFVVVGEVLLEVAAQRAPVPHDDVVEALAARGTDHAFDERICQGERGAVTTSSMPMACVTCWSADP